jgi:hypothetical protein
MQFVLSSRVGTSREIALAGEKKKKIGPIGGKPMVASGLDCASLLGSR